MAAVVRGVARRASALARRRRRRTLASPLPIPTHHALSRLRCVPRSADSFRMLV
jgi:hypothetical protein